MSTDTTDTKGVFVIGEFLGYKEVPWTSDPRKFNRRIGICTGEGEDQFGQVAKFTTVVDIQQEDVGFIRSIEKDLIGKIVVVPVVYRARKGGKDGAFLSCFMPKKSEIALLQNFNQPGSLKEAG